MSTATTLGRLAMKHARNAVAESMYLKGLGDVTRPTTVYGIVNERCNYKCRYCEFWRMKEYQDEMSIDQWKEALGSLQEFVGRYHIEFSGGEPFIKKGILDLFEFCHQQGLQWGVTTNGSALKTKIIRRVVDAQPFNINISIDSHEADVHDYARGIEGSLEQITAGIRELIQARDASGQDFPIIIKPVVHKLNFRTLPKMAEWVQDLGASAVNFQPVDRWTQETYDELWIEEEDIDELEGVAAELLRMKKQGAPIMTSELILQHWGAHFREEKAPPEVMPCRVGLRNYFIRPNGDIEVCWFYPPIGNVKTHSAREIWHSEEARQRRKETVACDRLCLFTCLSQKKLTDKVKMGLTMLSGTKKSKSSSIPSRQERKEPELVQLVTGK